jgi:general secretion pathway protein G
MILQQRRDHNRSARTGFTLMEVLVVVAILVVLAGIGVGVFAYLESSKENACKLQIKNLETAVNNYKLQHGSFPDSLQVLTVPNEGKPAFLKRKDLNDPWNRPFQYDPSKLSPTGEPLISSQGANPGTSPPIQSWQP